MSRPSPQDILLKANFSIRQQKFYEMCTAKDPSQTGYSSPLEALDYLQKQVSQAVDFKDEEMTKTFSRLATCLFPWGRKLSGYPEPEQVQPREEFYEKTVNRDGDDVGDVGGLLGGGEISMEPRGN